jgi:shikimate kinase
MNLFLIGLPGSGKSTLGRELAKLLGLKIVDTDAEIIQVEGKSIEAIFADQGENYFRETEQAILKNISENDGQLISTGGGMPCFFDNMDHMNQRGISIFIDVPVETIHQRLIGQRSQNRPMLVGKTDEEVLNFLKLKYEERIPFYAKATVCVKGSNIKVNEIVAELKNRKLI